MLKIRTSVTTPGGKIPPNVIAFSRGPIVAASAITNSRSGNAIVISVSREMTVSVAPRK